MFLKSHFLTRTLPQLLHHKTRNAPYLGIFRYRNAFKNTFLFLFILFISCGNTTKEVSSNDASKNVSTNTSNVSSADIIIGANQTELYLPLLKGKKVAVVGNQTSVIFKKTATQHTHLVDSLLSRGVQIKKVFAPEHGFRGKADAGEHIIDGKDQKTGLPILSLYGKNKKPSAAVLANIDLIIFDIQDVGARFYTYISSLHYVMQAAAENNIEVLILDRPNPNGHYIDGPILDSKYSSFVGLHPVPIVHGMTIAEYAQMINGQGWLGKGLRCNLHLIKMKNYNHARKYSLPIKPSPNLPNDKAINLYTSLCFFEGTNVNAGRGTDQQFQIYGSPFLPKTSSFSYTPIANSGAKYPKHKGKRCYGQNLSSTPTLNSINLDWLINAYQQTQDKSKFFNNFFSKLAGTSLLQQQIENGLSASEIKKTWAADLNIYKKMRTSYLLYP